MLKIFINIYLMNSLNIYSIMYSFFILYLYLYLLSYLY